MGDCGMSADDDIVCASVRLPDPLNKELEDQLGYDDTKDGWIKEAIRQRLARESGREDVQKRDSVPAEQ
jgi:hypothetical protein